MMPIDLERRSLLARRVPRGDVIPGRAYVIHARNGGIGVALLRDAELRYRLHRVKFDDHYLFDEVDWEDSAVHGTAIPLRLLPDAPPADAAALLDWLAERERELAGEVKAAWREVLGELADIAEDGR